VVWEGDTKKKGCQSKRGTNDVLHPSPISTVTTWTFLELKFEKGRKGNLPWLGRLRGGSILLLNEGGRGEMKVAAPRACLSPCHCLFRVMRKRYLFGNNVRER